MHPPEVTEATVPAVPNPGVRMIGSVLVRNEDVFVEQAIRNVARVCDRIHAVDHASGDRTWEILRTLESELDHLEVLRSKNSAVAHRLLERYAGTRTWVLGVDGDELYDPAGLARLRTQLEGGAHADVFRLKAHVLNCDEIDWQRRTAAGWLAPPSRPVTKLFNFGAVDSWTNSLDPLQSGDVVFRPGYDWESRRDLADETEWETDPLRLVHVCFLRRSSRDPEQTRVIRLNLEESLEYRRGVLGWLRRRVRPHPLPADIEATLARGGDWKREWYARGDRVVVDATPFLPPSPAA
jgi:Glycosyl transferase family 2